jgi:hypothetical protein
MISRPPRGRPDGGVQRLGNETARCGRHIIAEGRATGRCVVLHFGMIRRMMAWIAACCSPSGSSMRLPSRSTPKRSGRGGIRARGKALRELAWEAHGSVSRAGESHTLAPAVFRRHSCDGDAGPADGDAGHSRAREAIEHRQMNHLASAQRCDGRASASPILARLNHPATRLMSAHARSASPTRERGGPTPAAVSRLAAARFSSKWSIRSRRFAGVHRWCSPRT